MGTSGRYAGGSQGLIPTWVGNPSAPVGDGGTPPPAGAPGTQSPGSGTGAPAQGTTPPTPGQPALGGALRGARISFNRFARGDGTRHLRRGAGKFVRTGMGGGGSATRSMGSSRQAAGGILAFARDFAATGATGALQAFNLGDLSGAPVDVVFPRLLEAICPPGGNVDEAIARQAFLSAVADLCEGFAGPLSSLTVDQLRTFLTDFIAYSIEGRIVNAIGTQLLDLPDTVTELESLQDQMHDFVHNCVQNSIGTELQDVAAIRDADIQAKIEGIYQATFDLIASFADEP